MHIFPCRESWLWINLDQSSLRLQNSLLRRLVVGLVWTRRRLRVTCLSRCWEIQETSGLTSEYEEENVIEIWSNPLFSFIVGGGKVCGCFGFRCIETSFVLCYIILEVKTGERGVALKLTHFSSLQADIRNQIQQLSQLQYLSCELFALFHLFTCNWQHSKKKYFCPV